MRFPLLRVFGNSRESPGKISNLHADFYDARQQLVGKDYEAEIAQFRAIFETAKPTNSVLDLGCGTARHIELLAGAGYEVTGVDHSPGMVKNAREKLARFGDRASVVEADVLKLDLGRTYDAVTTLLSVLGYFIDSAALRNALSVVHRHLRPGGLFLFDIIDADELARSATPRACEIFEEHGHQLVRTNSRVIDVRNQTVEYTFGMWLWDMNNRQLIEHLG